MEGMAASVNRRRESATKEKFDFLTLLHFFLRGRGETMQARQAMKTRQFTHIHHAFALMALLPSVLNTSCIN
jgi:hypothetical protein